MAPRHGQPPPASPARPLPLARPPLGRSPLKSPAKPPRGRRRTGWRVAALLAVTALAVVRWRAGRRAWELGGHGALCLCAHCAHGAALAARLQASQLWVAGLLHGGMDISMTLLAAEGRPAALLAGLAAAAARPRERLERSKQE